MAAFADDIAYNTHDLDDGLRAGLFGFEEIADLPVVGEALREARRLTEDDKRVRNEMSRRVIHWMIGDVVAESLARLQALAPADVDAVRKAAAPVVGFSVAIAEASGRIKAFLFEHMYRHWRVNRMAFKARQVTKALGVLLLEQPDLLPDEWRGRAGAGGSAQAAEIVRDYVAGMTDRYALQEYSRLTDPSVQA